MSNLRLPFEQDQDSVESRIDARDRAGRARAVDPRFNVALEASAGTGKTRVLVDRYINLLRAGVDPSNILAITFTRKAAAEMRERIISSLRTAAARGEFPPSQWRDLRDRTGDIAISTIDAFCLSLLREFPLEADLDPGFSMADDTEVPRLIDESLDRALRVCRGLAREDENVALVFAQLGDRRARAGLAALLNRRIVAPGVLARYLAGSPRDLTVDTAARRGAAALRGVFAAMNGGLEGFVRTGPQDPAFQLLVRLMRLLPAAPLGDPEPPVALDPAMVQAAFARARDYFLTQDGEPRSRLLQPKTMFASQSDWQTHRDMVVGHAGRVSEAFDGYRRDLNVLVSRGVLRMFKVAETEYRRTLDAHAVLDFSDVLLRALDLLRQMEEFAQSRYRLESRYHHVLVDEFQDTSRAQWELISLLVQSWGEGAGLAHAGPLPPSIFIVGDRKQSIYSFRDADASVLQEAARHLDSLRRDGDVRRSISRSFRSVPAILAFVNDVCHDIEKAPTRRDGFGYGEEDRFPLDAAEAAAAGADGAKFARPATALGLVVASSPESCAEITAAEVARLIATGETVRDRDTGIARPVRAGDVAILFRTRETHREFEAALERLGVSAYVYKGLGFFDADEIKDVLALLWYLADPLSDLRAAAWLRSRFVRLSDEGLRLLAPRLAAAIRGQVAGDDTRPSDPSLDAHDAGALANARAAAAAWLPLVDRLPPAELLDQVLRQSAYGVELRGPRFAQARENLKKIRALVRRIQNRGYATLARIVAHLDRLAVGDEANAVIDALDAVNLMTVHAAKGLEFPVVFVVNLARGIGNRRDPIRVATDPSAESPSVSVGDFQSDADEDLAAKEREETKRLLYVALTRARDRLYLGTVLKEGQVQPGRGSLAEVMPPSLRERMSEAAMLAQGAAGGASAIEWRASSGQAHALQVCALPAIAVEVVGPVDRDELPAAAADFQSLGDVADTRQSVAEAIEGEVHEATALRAGRGSDRLLGTLVHRLIQKLGLGVNVAAALVREQAARLIRPDDLVELADPDVLVEGAVAAYAVLQARADLRELYGSGTAMHEVPFTMRTGGRIMRGTIDCLVYGEANQVTVLEFKTGRPRPEHQTQVALYQRAAELVFAGAIVQSQVIYLADIVAIP